MTCNRPALQNAQLYNLINNLSVVIEFSNIFSFKKFNLNQINQTI